MNEKNCPVYFRNDYNVFYDTSSRSGRRDWLRQRNVSDLRVYQRLRRPAGYQRSEFEYSRHQQQHLRGLQAAHDINNCGGILLQSNYKPSGELRADIGVLQHDNKNSQHAIGYTSNRTTSDGVKHE